MAPSPTPPIYLMSPPRKDWSLRGKANFKSAAADAADASKARQEWAALADAIVAAGGEVLVCPPHPEQALTGMIYTAEAGELYRDARGETRFLLPNMAAAHRRLEADHLGPFFEALGIATERASAVWEAQGDAIRASGADEIVHTFGTGPFARTTRAAYAELAQRLGGRHIQLEFLADPWFHGNTFLQILRHPSAPRALVVVCPEALAPGELERLQAFLPDARFVTISAAQSQGYDTNSLQVNETVIAPQSLSQTARAAIEDFGLVVRTLDLSELFLKGGGAPVCLTNRLWAMDEGELPERFCWSKLGSIEAVTEA
ncbi:MAG: hypothetical protein H0U74_20470 [Bradymonadaceae bacterium]|nr:hypothetical protein [Lujinxingiaceae bacterium]